MRSADLVKGLSSPLLCAPARRPAHLLGCLTSPRLAACLAACVGAPPLDSALSLCTPFACTSGAGVPCAYSGHLPLCPPGGTHFKSSDCHPHHPLPPIATHYQKTRKKKQAPSISELSRTPSEPRRAHLQRGAPATQPPTRALPHTPPPHPHASTAALSPSELNAPGGASLASPCQCLQAIPN
jgi:hypothetical protein